jgi:hypothetical protein
VVGRLVQRSRSIPEAGVIDLSEPLEVLALVWGTGLEAVFLLILLRIFQPPPPEPGPAARRPAFLERFALLPGWIVCFAVLLPLVLCLALPGGALVAIVGWWAAALGLFGLTVRQTLKANIALGLFNWALVLAVGAALSDRSIRPPPARALGVEPPTGLVSRCSPGARVSPSRTGR